MEDHEKITVNIPPIVEEKLAIWAIRNTIIDPISVFENYPICPN